MFKTSVPPFVVVALSQLLASQDESDSVCRGSLKDISVDLEKCAVSPRALDLGIACLRQMKDLRRAVQSLGATLQTEISSVEASVIPASRSQGFAKLPKDTFNYILDVLARSCVDDTRSREELIKSLSLVSRRFRQGVLSTMALWSRWSDWVLYRTPTMFARVQELSTEAPLFVDTEGCSLRYIESGEELKRFVEGCLGHKERWITLRTDTSRIAALIREEGTFQEVSFPTVNCLILSGSSTDRTAVHTFLANWTFPGVTSLSLRDMLPPHGIFEDVLRLSLSGTLQQDFQEILDVLEQFRKLERLDIDDAIFVFGHGLDRSTLQNHLAVAPVELPRLRHLRLCNKKQGGDSFTPCPELVLRLFIESLRLPALRSISARLHSLVDNANFLGTVFSSSHNVLDALEAFELEELGAGGEKRCYRSTALGTFLAALPSLSSLKLGSCDDIRYLIDFSDAGMLEGGLTNLHSLTLGYSKAYDQETTHSLPAELINSFVDNGAPLERVIILSRDEQALKDAQAVFPSAHRVWFTNASVLR